MLKSFIKGILFSCGILLPLIIVGGTVYATQIIPVANTSIGSYEITSKGYEFTWLEDTTILGTEVVETQSGGIITGYLDDPRHTPIVKKGKIIIFSTLPSSIVTSKLDYELGLQGFSRSGGKSVVDALIKTDTITVIK